MELSWNSAGERLYETGVDRCVLYPTLDKGIAWNGITEIAEEEAGGEVQTQYADGVKYVNLAAASEFELSLSAYTYPDEFEEFNGSLEIDKGVHAHQQPRGSFNLSYRTLIGNDLQGSNFGYKIHIVYNARATPEEYTYSSTSDEPGAEPFSWGLTTEGVDIAGAYPSAHITVKSTDVSKFAMRAFESHLYGYISSPRLLSASEIVNFPWAMRPIGILFSTDPRLKSVILTGDVVYDTSNNSIYSVGAESPNTRKVISMTKANVAQIPKNSYPGDILYDETTGNLYVLGE